ncbi:hypothetical protein PR048_026351 [Dryococelus australis]|uniref:Uncharacterized protein n=1 Tax=Dryococelus australis TaxID=614101 RepID=A0ABQ9GL26_9NEOP|nr:hypothetical protein PR048_026351 [Dryococelus australis]
MPLPFSNPNLKSNGTLLRKDKWPTSTIPIAHPALLNETAIFCHPITPPHDFTCHCRTRNPSSNEDARVHASSTPPPSAHHSVPVIPAHGTIEQTAAVVLCNKCGCSVAITATIDFFIINSNKCQFTHTNHNRRSCASINNTNQVACTALLQTCAGPAYTQNKHPVLQIPFWENHVSANKSTLQKNKQNHMQFNYGHMNGALILYGFMERDRIQSEMMLAYPNILSGNQLPPTHCQEPMCYGVGIDIVKYRHCRHQIHQRCVPLNVWIADMEQPYEFQAFTMRHNNMLALFQSLPMFASVPTEECRACLEDCTTQLHHYDACEEVWPNGVGGQLSRDA